jgi:hypothetical protein
MSQGLATQSVEKRSLQATPSRQDKAIAHAREAERTRKRQALILQRNRILSEHAASPIRRSALANALADIEEKLSELGWTVHM